MSESTTRSSLSLNRRRFLNRSLLASGTLLVPVVISGCKNKKSRQEMTWLDQLVGENDKAVEGLLEKQNTDPASPNFGGVPDQFDIYHPGSASGLIQRFTGSYVSPSSGYFQKELLVDRMEQAIDFLLMHQHEDGTIDLLTTNFHSTPDTGFVVEPLAVSYFVLNKNGQQSTLPLQQKIREFLLKAGDALAVGGIHTPNHRWVVSMAMARINALFPDQKYLDRINQWLTEGIDIDADGQFTERSTSVYSPLTDRCLMTIARLTGREELYEPVRKNLDMTPYFIHPNAEIATEVSRRQDQYRAATPARYHYPYRYMSRLDQNGLYGAMAQYIEENLGAENLSGDLIYYLEMPDLLQPNPLAEIPTNYRKHFSVSDLVRIRRGNWDASILAKNAALVTFHHGNAVLQGVRIASAFFGKGQFVADSMEVEDGKITLLQTLTGPYYQPIDPELIVADGDWEKMPRYKRPKSEIQEMFYKLVVEETEKGLTLDFSAEGTDAVPVAIELSFRSGGKLIGTEKAGHGEEVYFVKENSCTFQSGKDKIIITGGRKEHEWTQLRGALPKIEGSSIYLTGFTPFQHGFSIERD